MDIGNSGHSLVRSDLAPDDFHLLASDFATDPDVKQAVTPWLHTFDTDFATDPDVKQAVTPWLHTFDTDFYVAVQTLVPR